MQRNKFLYNKTNRRTNSQIYSGTKVYMCRIRMELQFHPDPARKLSANLYNMCQCRLYSEELLMMGRETAEIM